VPHVRRPLRIEEPSARPWKTIRVASPLPPLFAPALHVNGATQTGLAGGGNPDGPSIEISGGGTADGDGFTLTSCHQAIANLAINGFRRYGIIGMPQSCDDTSSSHIFASVTGNFIGVDPTGSTAVPNLRGIFTFGRENVAIDSNVISGNVRSGIFALGGNLRIDDNRIGVAAHADTPLPNGASGIYVEASVLQFAGIFRNVIAFNREFGIAIDRKAQWAGGSENRIWGNGGLAVDDGLDGPSPIVTTPLARVATPVITSAVYDPATGETTIRGTVAAPNEFEVSSRVEIFASDAPGLFGFGDAQRFLGRTTPGDFELKVNGDLRGQWVAAMVNVIYAYTDIAIAPHRMTELGRAVQVR
jgi:Periplasmic copper-binding protein (NosD)